MGGGDFEEAGGFVEGGAAEGGLVFAEGVGGEEDEGGSCVDDAWGGGLVNDGRGNLGENVPAVLDRMGLPP